MLRFSIVLFAMSLLMGYNYAQKPLLDILNEELQREFEALQKEEVPPYYIEYKVNDVKSVDIVSSFGSLILNQKDHQRILSILVRVGDYNLDNTHIDDQGESANTYYYNTTIPLDSDELAIKQIAWWYTNKAYKNALSNYLNIQKDDDNELNDDVKDFSEDDAHQFGGKLVSKLNVDTNLWQQRIKSYSEKFLQDTAIISGEASFSYVIENKYFVSTEGASIQQTAEYAQLHLGGSVRTSDGEMMPYYQSFIAKTPDGLPSDMEAQKEVDRIYTLLDQFKTCPKAEPYSGPAILSPGATGVFFHEIFGHRIEGHRLQDVSDAHTFKEMVGKEVLPNFFNVTFDPLQEKFEEKDLIGHYLYDDEGVKAQKVDIIQEGVLKGFLMSRKPSDLSPKSNGHGRAQAGYIPVTRQSNMFVSSNKPLTNEELRKRLIKACKKQKKSYGYFFKEVIGGFTMTSRYSPNVFNIFPIEVYRIYVDGRPDELVRGVELIGTPLAMFAEIAAAGNQFDIFNGFCGAESGNVPVSTIAPAIFVEKIETQNQPNVQINVPLLSRPKE